MIRYLIITANEDAEHEVFCYEDRNKAYKELKDEIDNDDSGTIGLYDITSVKGDEPLQLASICDGEYDEYVPEDENLVEVKWLADKIWDGGVMKVEDILSAMEYDKIKEMNNFILKNKMFFEQNGLPFKGDNVIFDTMVRNNKGAQYITEMYSKLDEPWG